MRVDLLIPLPAQAEYWEYETVVDPESNETTKMYSKSADIKLSVFASAGTHYAFTRDYLEYSGQLRNITDGGGKPILNMEGDLRFMFLGTAEAQFDVYGNVIGYKYQLTKNPGTL